MEWLQSIFGGAFGATFFSLISEFGEDLLCVAILGFFYWGINKEIGKAVGINIVAVNIWNPFLKNIVVRRRPYFDNPSIKVLKPVEADADLYDITAQGYSFPSGHSSTSGAAYWTLAGKLKKKWLKVVLIIIPFMVGISRFVLGVHYPTDVMAGWALGLMIMLIVPVLRRRIKNDWFFYGFFLVLGLPGFFFCDINEFYTGYGMFLGAAAGFMFEEHFVKFDNTKNVLRCALRTVVGGGLFLGLNEVLKLPFSKDLLESASTAQFLIRTLRYAIVLFLVVGVYPMLFKYTAKIGKKDK